MRNEYMVLLDNDDITRYLYGQVKSLKEVISDLDIFKTIKDFVTSGGFDRNKTPFDNKVELMSYMAFKRHYYDRHPNNNLNNF